MTHTLHCRFVRENKAGTAVLVIDDSLGEELWFPMSAVIERHNFGPGQSGKMLVEDWIAKAKGLE